MTTDSFSTARILLVNDDGIDAPGIQALREALEGRCELLVAAPYSERSGAGCSLSIFTEMMVEKRRREDGSIWGYAVDGTPVECVKFVKTTLRDYRPDLVLSGINRGRNVGNSVFYSGTVAGAVEACFFGLRSMAVSLNARKAEGAHFDTAAEMTARMVPWLLRQPWRPRSIWNLNVPDVPLADVRGVRFTHQGTAFYVDDYVQTRVEGDRLYLKNVGEHVVESPEPLHSDDRVLAEGAASLSLLSLDMTVDLPGPARQALEDSWNRMVLGTD